MVRRSYVAAARRLRLSLVAGIAAAAVGGGAHPTARAVAATPASTTAASALRIWYATDDPSEPTWVQELVRRYNVTHRGAPATLTPYNLDDLNNKLALALTASAGPDLVYTTPRGPGLPAYVRAGKLRDLTAASRAHGWATALRPGLLAEYNRLLAANGGRRAAGRVYAVPYALAAVGVLYNKAIFRRLGLRAPHTLGEMEASLARVKRAGLTPLGLGNADGWVGDDWYLTLVNARVAPSTLAAALRLSPSFSFAGAPYRAAAATLQNWARQGYFTHGFGGLDAQDSVEAFFEGHTAMQLVSSSENAQILTLVKESRADVGVFAFPSARAGAAPVMPQSGYAGWAVPNASRNPSAAVDFVTSIVSGETASTLLAHGLLPARPVSVAAARAVAPFQRDYIAALDGATPGVYLDSAPIPNINATMEANVQLLLQNVESPDFLIHSLQEVYASRGARASATRTDGEF